MTDIVKRADINRSTFYAHYPDVLGVVEEMGDESIVRLDAHLSQLPQDYCLRNPAPLLRQLNRYLEEEQEFYRLLYRYGGISPFMENLKKLMARHYKPQAEQATATEVGPAVKIQISFFYDGLGGLYRRWLRGELPCALDEATDAVSELAIQAADALFRQYQAT